MGVIAGHYRLTIENLNKIGKKQEMDYDICIESLDLDKSWHLITRFLNDNHPTKYFDWQDVLELAEYDIFIYHDEYQREAINYNSAWMVKKISEHLLKIEIEEVKNKFLNWNISNVAGFSNHINDEKLFKYFFKYFVNMIEFYKRAAADNNFVIVMID